MPQTQLSVKPLNHPISIAFVDEGFLSYFNFNSSNFFDYLNPYNFSNSSNHLKFLFLHLAIFCLLLQSLVQPMVFTVPTSLKQISAKSFIGFKPSLALNDSPQENLLKKPNSAQNASPAFNNFKSSPSSAQNASSLLFASLQDDSRQPLRRSLRSLLNPFWLKTLFAFF